LSVEQTDVPMVFEVINDRGVKLKPYEILKGKLLGQIDKLLLESKNYNELWETSLKRINKFSDDEADRFFRFYLKSKFADTRAEGQKFDGDYHRIIFSSSFQSKLCLDHNPKGVVDFLDTDFTYYSKVYANLLNKLSNDSNSYFTFNSLNDLDGSLLLGLSFCTINDPKEDEKLNCIAQEIDRFFALLQLQNCYESNAFQESLYRISSEIREQELSIIRSVFDKELKSQIEKKRQVQPENPFDYSLFKNTGDNLNARFKRYFFARVEGFLAKNLNVEMRHSYKPLVSNTGSVNGFHIEHILSRNAQSLALFNNQEDLFVNERNRLGGILLLKGKDNISSNNESYDEKLKTYSGTLLWNETLREDFYKSNLDFKAFREKFDLKEFEGINVFDRDALETRQKILFKMATHIWA
ncbi:MAG: HNH endonuclease family protein, partial [Candidatus Acinetobacter avistercoris]|nr:HNH endonuclease family protein [Candidatus Acinetobacter avistercoris]